MTRTAARPARMPPLPPRPGWARLAVAAAAVAATWFNLWVSFGPLRDPSRIQGEAMRGFGRESVFYTMHGNVAAAVYAALAAALAGAEAAGLAPPPPPPGGATAVGGWAAVASVVYGAGAVVLTAVALVVGLGYYVLIHFHPAVRLRAAAEPDFDLIMGCLHVIPVVAMSALVATHPPARLAAHAVSVRTAVGVLVAHGVAYAVWSAVCVAVNGGHWPYPFQVGLSLGGHLAIDAVVMAVGCAACAGVAGAVRRRAGGGRVKAA